MSPQPPINEANQELPKETPSGVSDNPTAPDTTLPQLIKDIPDAHNSVISKGIVALEVSFESGEQTTHKIYFPHAVVITEARAQVTKALAATNSGTITLKNNAGTAMANGVITFSASAPLSTLGFCKPTSNQGIASTNYLQITVAKTTAGGRARVEIHFYKLIR